MDNDTKDTVTLGRGGRVGRSPYSRVKQLAAATMLLLETETEGTK